MSEFGKEYGMVLFDVRADKFKEVIEYLRPAKDYVESRYPTLREVDWEEEPHYVGGPVTELSAPNAYCPVGWYGQLRSTDE